MDGFEVELWAADGAGNYLPALRCLAPDIRQDVSEIEVTDLNPVKRNPERTRWRVILALLSLRRPPPRYVRDTSREGFRQFESGLRSVTMRSPCAIMTDDGFLCAQHSASIGRTLRVMVGGLHEADAFLTELGNHGRTFYVVATIIPSRKDAPHEDPRIEGQRL